MKNQELAKYCKLYEGNSEGFLIPGLPIFIRLDGRSFHSFTKKLNKPFDTNLVDTMRKTTMALVNEWNAFLGYTQSDEITLVILYNPEAPIEDLFFKGRLFKWQSTIASSCTAYFSDFSFEWRKPLSLKSPTFDCRVWQAPREYLYKYLIWREDDAIRNSVSMLAHATFSHKNLLNKNTKEVLALLKNEGIDWQNLDSRYKRGSFFVKQEIERAFTPVEISLLPEQHEAKKNPNLLVKRSEILEIFPPRIRSLDPNIIFTYFCSEC